MSQLSKELCFICWSRKLCWSSWSILCASRYDGMDTSNIITIKERAFSFSVMVVVATTFSSWLWSTSFSSPVVASISTKSSFVNFWWDSWASSIGLSIDLIEIGLHSSKECIVVSNSWSTIFSQTWTLTLTTLLIEASLIRLIDFEGKKC